MGVQRMARAARGRELHRYDVIVRRHVSRYGLPTRAIVGSGRCETFRSKQTWNAPRHDPYNKMTSEADIALHILANIRANLGSIASLLSTPADIRIIHSFHSKYLGHVALLVTAAHRVLSLANTTGHEINSLKDLLSMDPVYITWGDAPTSPRQYAFILGKGRVDTEAGITAMLSETLARADNYWQTIKGVWHRRTKPCSHAPCASPNCHPYLTQS